MFMLPLPIIPKLILAGLLTVILIFYFLRDALLVMSTSFVEFYFKQDFIELTTLGGKKISGRILETSFVTPFLTILNVSPINTKYKTSNIVIFPDSMDIEQFRELRVRLRWER